MDRTQTTLRDIGQPHTAVITTLDHGQLRAGAADAAAAVPIAAAAAAVRIRGDFEQFGRRTTAQIAGAPEIR